MLIGAHHLVSEGLWAAHGIEAKTAVAAFVVGVALEITGMGGGALMTPALNWGQGGDQTNAPLIAAIGLALLVLIAFVWGLLRRGVGLPMFDWSLGRAGPSRGGPQPTAG